MWIILTQQAFVLMKTSWRRLEGILVFVFGGIKTNIFALLMRLQKTSPKRLQDAFIKTNIFVLVIRLQDVFKTSSRRITKTFSRRLQYVLQKRLQDVLKTSSRHLQDVMQRCLQDLFKTYHRVNLLLVTRFQDVFEKFSKRF